MKKLRHLIRPAILVLLAIPLCLSPANPQSSTATAPVYKITPGVSKISFGVKASISIEGTFDKWNSSLTFTSPDASTGVLDVRIQADSLDTGSSFKDDKLKSKDFFNASADPYITFHSTKITQTGPNTFNVAGVFTIRGVSKPENLTLVDDREGKGTGQIKGTMAFDRKDFGMDSGIPFYQDR